VIVYEAMVESTGELRVFRTTEQQEQERRDRAAFLGGIFAAGGRMAFNFKNQTKSHAGIERKYSYAYPVITFADANSKKIDKLKEMFGGRVKVKHKDEKSFTWYLQSGNTVEFARALLGFCPNREEMIMAFENWENVNVEEQLRVAKDFKNTEVPKAEDYKNLVRNPQFLAGVLTARGGLSNAFRRGSPRETVLFFSSTNKQLAMALKQEYGAGIMPVGEKSNQTTFGEAATTRILELIQDHLLVPLQDLPEDE